MNPITCNVSSGTVVDYRFPTCCAGRIRFAIKKVDILLPHKERREVDRVRASCRIVVSNRHNRTARCPNTCASRVSHRNCESLRTFCKTIIHDGDGYRFRCLARVESNRAQRRSIVTTRRSNSIKDIAVCETCRVSRYVFNRRRIGAAADAGDCERGARTAFSDAEVGSVDHRGSKLKGVGDQLEAVENCRTGIRRSRGSRTQLSRQS